MLPNTFSGSTSRKGSGSASIGCMPISTWNRAIFDLSSFALVNTWIGRRLDCRPGSRTASVAPLAPRMASISARTRSTCWCTSLGVIESSSKLRMLCADTAVAGTKISAPATTAASIRPTVEPQGKVVASYSRMGV